MNNNVEKLLNEIGKLVVAQNERTKERYSHGELFNVFNILAHLQILLDKYVGDEGSRN